MPPRALRLLPIALGGLLLAAPPPGAGEAVAARPAVVLELFTSQGCSSCPAADRVLGKLARETRRDDLLLVPLAFHVDYWNRIGWVDPFSSSSWSARQRRYAAVFGLRSVYTPQIVLNGRAELVGSHERRLRHEIPAAADVRPAGRVELAAVRLDGEASELVVEVVAELLGEPSGATLVANLALFENGLVTGVDSGENAGRTLVNDYVVRLLLPAIRLAPGGAPLQRERVRIGLDRGWRVDGLGLAAFLQDSDTLEIHAAVARERLAGASPST